MTDAVDSAGKRRVRTRIGSPTGEKQRITCRFARTWLMKYSQHDSRVSGTPARLTAGAPR